jgi:formylglycine-generating enzyme required for sulfatase activity
MLDPPVSPRTTPEFGFMFHYVHSAAFTDSAMNLGLGEKFDMFNNFLFGCMPGVEVQEKKRMYSDQLDFMLANEHISQEAWANMRNHYDAVFGAMEKNKITSLDARRSEVYYNTVIQCAREAVKERGYTPDAIISVEHEFMHLETMMYYFWHVAATEQRLDKLACFRNPSADIAFADPARPSHSNPKEVTVIVPGGHVTMGINEGEVVGHVWDNEMPVRQSEVADFEVMKFPVTNQQFRSFLRAQQEDVSEVFARDNHPAICNFEEAKAFCEWQGGRLMTEAEYHKLFRDDCDFQHCARLGNNDFKIGDTTEVGSMSDASTCGVYDLVGNGWEWTGTQFVAHDGYKIEEMYLGYSAPWFDGRHHVLKGAGCFTGSVLLRQTFRNFTSPKGPLFAKFRVAWDRG